MRCPQCRNRVLQKSGEVTRLRIQGALEFGPAGEAKAKCFWCKAELTLPLQLAQEALGAVEAEAFTIKAS